MPPASGLLGVTADWTGARDKPVTSVCHRMEQTFPQYSSGNTLDTAVPLPLALRKTGHCMGTGAWVHHRLV